MRYVPLIDRVVLSRHRPPVEVLEDLREIAVDPIRGIGIEPRPGRGLEDALGEKVVREARRGSCPRLAFSEV